MSGPERNPINPPIGDSSQRLVATGQTVCVTARWPSETSLRRHGYEGLEQWEPTGFIASMGWGKSRPRSGSPRRMTRQRSRLRKTWSTGTPASSGLSRAWLFALRESDRFVPVAACLNDASTHRKDENNQVLGRSTSHTSELRWAEARDRPRLFFAQTGVEHA